MENKKDYCEKLYHRYIELKEKTESRENNPKNIPFASDVLEKARLREGVLECLEFLSENQLKELLENSNFIVSVITELRRRKENIIGDLRCEKCEKFMKKSGPYLHIKPEREDAYKGVYEVYYSCMNENCDNFMKSIKVLEK